MESQGAITKRDLNLDTALGGQGDVWTHRMAQRNMQRDPDRDLKRKKMETFSLFGKRKNEIKLGLVLKKDVQM